MANCKVFGMRRSMILFRQNIHKSQGFTLIELLIAIGMFSFVLLLVATTFIQINRAYTGGITTKRVHEEARLALNSITSDFRTASSGSQVEIYCGTEPDCGNNPEIPTRVLCYDEKAYVFREPDGSDPGRLGLIEGAGCDDADTVDLNGGVSQFGDLLQVQFFRVSEVVPDKTYNIEIAVSTSSHTDDLLQAIDSGAGEGIRDLMCNPAQTGSQYCRVVLLNSLVTIRGN